MKIEKTIASWLRHTTVATALLMTVTISLQARPITREQARQQAASFMNQHNDKRMLTAVDIPQKLGPRHASQQSTAESYYVFDKGINDGYIIISGDDATAESVLGYCDSGSFDYDNLPPAMQKWLDDYATQIAQLQARQQEKAVAAAPVRRVPTHPAIAEMLTCNWNQGSPYNDECPIYFNNSLGRSVTGCVATAYAQILYFQREKMVTETQAAMPAYDTYTEHATYGHLHVQGIPKGSPIDWDNMRDNYSGNESAIQKKAVAQLMHYCGVAVKMDYTSSSSGAQSYEVFNALKQYFGFGSSVRYVSYQNVTSDDQWDELCYNELAEGRPFYISGSNSEAGHAFVCDGYDGERRYHINWGWGGTSNGHYYLSNLTPGQQGIGGSSDGYNGYREVIIGIEPENYADRALSFSDARTRKVCTEAFDQDGDGILTYGEAAAVKELGSVLQGTDIATFTELHYFTGLTKIDDAAFKDCQQLTQVQLPKQLESIGKQAFMGCKNMRTINLPESLDNIGEEAFRDCATFSEIALPQSLSAIEASTFGGCESLQELTLPISIRLIGDGALAGCTSLKDVYVKTMQPESIMLGEGVFTGISTEATLHVMQGTRDFFEQEAQWKEFAKIKETRELSRGEFAPFEVNKTYYLYHASTGRYLTKGEAWGTQAVVGQKNPMRFVAGRTNAMPEGTYYLTSEDTERSGHYLFRTNTDANVGQGVQAAFVDGNNLTNTAHWAITDLGDSTYTLSIPKGYANYKANCRWGVQTDHASNAASPTWGVYSDIVYEGHEQNCQWRLVAYDADKVANYNAAMTLQTLIELAEAKKLNTTQEQEVLDNLQSTTDELLAAQSSLRKKLKLVDFADAQVRSICVSNFDIDGDGELSQSEVSQIGVFGELFKGTNITSFDELQYFTSVNYLAGNSFNGCRQLSSIVLPTSMESIYYNAFRNCEKLESINLPEYINYIGSNAFYGCKNLKTVTVLCPDPAAITLHGTAFDGISQQEATLEVPVGSKALYEQANIWKKFGTIVEIRTRTQPRFSPISEGATGYVYNVGTRKFLSKGEAYGTQSVVAQQGMVYEWRRSNSMGEGQYYLYSTETGKDGKVLFRTSSDSKVGEGVKACFVDGTLSSSAYWQVDSVGQDTYTLQVPAKDDNYVEGEYFGTQSEHQSGAASPTDGTYWDVSLSSLETRCQWRFITVEDMQAAKQQDANVEELKSLLDRCEEKQIDKTAEQAVYDNLYSSALEIEDAIASLRDKLHYITFSDNRAKSLCLSAWDLDGDEELSWEEAALVTDLGETFRNQSTLKSLDELRYFTALTEIPENAFRNSSNITSVYLPEKVTMLNKYAFLGCSALKYVVMMNEQAVVGESMCGLPAAATLFVPQSQMDNYQADDKWQTYKLTVFTGQPVVKAKPASRQYGRSAAAMKFEVSGAPINGEPELSCAEVSEPTTPVGVYTINVNPGTITNRNLVCENGELTIIPAALTITAKSYTRHEGEENPAFEVTYKGWRNRETAEVLLQQPVITCNATPNSPAGEYPIVVSGAQAQNYEITYNDGVLTVEPGTNGIRSISDNSNDEPIYDLQGRQARKSSRGGIYITRQKRKVVR
ncbi:MAG: leucine-rich repeat protein [Prevotella sp.]|nr:leucine-rich repeat protein [Prevotella sp.]